MISFQPLIFLPQNAAGQTLQDAEVENAANEKLAKQLNQMFPGKSCKYHPDHQSVVLVNLREELDFLRVVSSCCDEFKAELESLSEPQKLYSTSH